jgi:hypothetical protein
MIWCFKQRPDCGYTNDPSGATYKISLTISLGRMSNLVKKETIIIGPPAKCVRHDITLPVHQRTNIITLGNYAPTIISDRDSDLVGVTIPQTQDVRDEKVQHKSMRWHRKILGKWTMEAVPKQELIIKPRRGWWGDYWTQRQFIEISKRMDFHKYVTRR